MFIPATPRGKEKQLNADRILGDLSMTKDI